MELFIKEHAGFVYVVISTLALLLWFFVKRELNRLDVKISKHNSYLEQIILVKNQYEIIKNELDYIKEKIELLHNKRE